MKAIRKTLLVVSVLGILLSAIVVGLIIRRIIQPLRELRDSAEAVGRGDFSRKIERFSNDECGDLAEAFNRMTSNLQTSRAELEKAVETIKATQAQLIQSEKLSAVGQFVAGVAHELNNPLTTVIGFSDLLRQTETDEKNRHYLDLVARSAHRCHKIVHSLLSFARQHAPERKLIELNAIVEEVLEIMAYDLRTSNVKIVKQFQAGLPALMADAHQLQQVFINILSNARQALETFRRDGEITVRTRLEGGSVRIEFQDNGPGISAENLLRIFDPFFTTKPVGKGTGLGLSLSYGIVKEHGGKITAVSRAGEGVMFVIELPASNEAITERPAIMQPASSRSPFAPAFSGKSVLVIDDEQWILLLAQELLARDGHGVVVAASGERAMEVLKTQKFDVIISDWKMPGLNGIHLFEHLLNVDPTAAQHMMFMTGDVINDSFQDFLRRNGKTCLPKPFSIDEFRVAIGRMATATDVK